MLSGRKQIVAAAILGSIAANMLPSMIQSPGVQASWCWKPVGEPTSTAFGCTKPDYYCKVADFTANTKGTDATCKSSPPGATKFVWDEAKHRPGGGCVVREACCDGYVCYQKGQCKGGAPSDDKDKANRTKAPLADQSKEWGVDWAKNADNKKNCTAAKVAQDAAAKTAGGGAKANKTNTANPAGNKKAAGNSVQSTISVAAVLLAATGYSFA